MGYGKNSTYEKRKNDRPDHFGRLRQQFDHNRKKIMATECRCGICGQPVDKSLKFPDPKSPCIDHIIPIAKGGNPVDLDNLQLAHLKCNRDKSDKVVTKQEIVTGFEICSNQVLPLTYDWTE